MTARVRVSERDLRALLGIVAEDRADVPAVGLPDSLLSELISVVRADCLSFQSHDSERQAVLFDQSVPPHAGDGGFDDDLASAFWKHYWQSLPCSYPERTGDLRSVTTISDFYSARQWHSTGMYQDCVPDVEHELMVCLLAGPGWAAGPGRTMRLIFFRGPGPDFSERDRALLTLLRPHLQQAYLDAERRRRPAPQLTPRQWELLRLVAAGHTNTRIARKLGVSEGTVRIHLQNIYARLHVSSRTAAVTRAFADLATM